MPLSINTAIVFVFIGNRLIIIRIPFISFVAIIILRITILSFVVVVVVHVVVSDGVGTLI